MRFQFDSESGPIPKRKIDFRMEIGSRVRIPLTPNIFFHKTSFNCFHLNTGRKTKKEEEEFNIFMSPNLIKTKEHKKTPKKRL